MKELFLGLLNMSLTGSFVILFVILTRLALKRAPKRFSYALWLVVLFRLLCPVSLSASVSLLNWLEPQVQSATPAASTVTYQLPERYTFERGAAVFSPQAASDQSPAASEQQEEAPELMDIAAHIWLAGVSILVLFSLGQYLRLRKRLRGAILFRKGIYLTDSVGTPFVMGVFRPRIYLPTGLSEQEQEFILAHEHQHIRRGDPVWKLLGFGALCIHWFNPLVWLAFQLASRDMEMSCDEAVIRKLGSRTRADYSSALLRLSTGTRALPGMPLAFGEGDAKGRIRNMARWRKPKIWVRIGCGAVCLVILLACGLNPSLAAGLQEGPCQIQMEELSFRLPEGFSYESDGKQPGSGEIYLENQLVGGVKTFPLPEDITGWDWLNTLELQEWSDETLGYYADGMAGDRITLEFFSDVPEGAERTVLRKHSLFFGQMLYDLWIDELLLDASQQQLLLSSAAIGEERIGTALPYEIGALPEGITRLNDESGDILFSNGTSIVGGITSYPIPEGVYDANDDIFLWLEEVGIPDYEDSSLVFWGGISGFDGGWNATFASDVPEGAPLTVKRSHHFMPAGAVVYDFWLDELLLDQQTQFAIEDGVRFVQAAVPESQPLSTEDEAFARCFSVMDGLQDGSVHIQSTYSYDNTPGDNYTEDCYFDDELGWLRLIQTAAGETRGELYANDRYFTAGDGELTWTQAEPPHQWSGPWLGSFYFVKHYVTYLGTVPTEQGDWCTFRVDAPFEEGAEGEPYYYVDFCFDTEGNFLKVQLQVNLFREDTFTLTQSIVSRDKATVAGAIEQEYRRAVS